MLSHKISGSGIPLVFLHAFPLDQEMWEESRQNLSRNFKVITFDLPGFGDSPSIGEVATMENLGTAVMESLDELGISERVVLSGVSMGGYVCFRILEKYPQRLRALGLISTRSKPDTEEARVKRFQTVKSIEKQGVENLAEAMPLTLLGEWAQRNNPPVVEAVRMAIRRASPNGVMAALRGMAERPDSTPLLRSISMPVLVLSGLDDKVVPTQEMREMAKEIPQAEFREVPRSGHLPPMEQSSEFLELFRNFLKRRVL